MQFTVAGMSTFRLSRIGLPVSSVSSKASSSVFAWISSANFCSTFLRAFGDCFAHTPCSNAARAEATARSISRASQADTCASTSPVAGFTRVNVAPEAASTY